MPGLCGFRQENAERLIFPDRPCDSLRVADQRRGGPGPEASLWPMVLPVHLSVSHPDRGRLARARFEHEDFAVRPFIILVLLYIVSIV